MKLRTILDLPPAQGNPRNSEGSFLPLSDGSVLFIYSHFTQSMRDDAAACLWALTIKDNAVVTPPHELIPSPEDGARNLMSVSLLRMENGDVGLFYLRRHGDTLLEMVLRRSGDEGKTWSEPTSVTTRKGFFVINNDRVIRLSRGSILVPAAEHKKSMNNDGTVAFDSRSEAVFFRSDDDGRTFHEMPGKGVMPYVSVSASGLQEPGVMEMPDGHLWCWARTDLGQQWEMSSYDAGAHWTPPSPSRFTAPLSPLSALTLRDGRMLAIHNPVPLYNGRSAYVNGVWTGGRTPLVLRVSRDGGNIWEEPVELENDPGAGYCYTAMLEEKDGELLLAYCAGGQEDGSCLSRLRVARLVLDEEEASK